MAQGNIKHLPSRSSRAGRLSGDEVSGLVQSAAAGDQQSWNEIVREYRGMIWAVARGHRLCDADAADVEQGTWLRLLDHLEDLREPASLGAWLATTARRECLRILRRSSREISFGEDFPDQQATDEPPDVQLLTGERDRALWRSFGLLRRSDQALLRLLMAYPRPAYDEIAAALDMPIGSIGPTRARALERLGRELQRDGALELLAA